MPAPRDRLSVMALFAIGTGLVVAAMAYAVLRSWPTFDPLASATLIGIGLLLIVIHERLAAILKELRELVALARGRAGLDDVAEDTDTPPRRPDGDRDGAERADTRLPPTGDRGE